MKETKAKKSTYLRNFIIAVALSAAILAAGALWVLLGWRSALDITLTDLAGDPAALRGFTMRGQSYFDTAHTYWSCTTATWTPASPSTQTRSTTRTATARGARRLTLCTL